VEEQTISRAEITWIDPAGDSFRLAESGMSKRASGQKKERQLIRVLSDAIDGRGFRKGGLHIWRSFPGLRKSASFAICANCMEHRAIPCNPDGTADNHKRLRYASIGPPSHGSDAREGRSRNTDCFVATTAWRTSYRT